MCRLLETIRYENGRFHNLKFHRQRMNHARKILFHLTDEIDLDKILLKARSEEHTSELQSH